MNPRFLHFDDRAAWELAVANAISSALDDALASRGVARFALAGGSTPAPVYTRLAASPRSWSNVHFYWGDERCVAPDDPRSNYRLARETLLDPLGIPSAHVHRIAGEIGPELAARQYEDRLREDLPLDAADRPVFDAILLGLGADGHTASLLPGDPALEQTRRWTAVVRGEMASPPVTRVTLTLPVLNAARSVLFAVAGAGKLDVVRAIERGSGGAARHPANRVRPASGATWYVCDC